LFQVHNLWLLTTIRSLVGLPLEYDYKYDNHVGQRGHKIVKAEYCFVGWFYTQRFILSFSAAYYSTISIMLKIHLGNTTCFFIDWTCELMLIWRISMHFCRRMFKNGFYDRYLSGRYLVTSGGTRILKGGGWLNGGHKRSHSDRIRP